MGAQQNDEKVIPMWIAVVIIVGVVVVLGFLLVILLPLNIKTNDDSLPTLARMAESQKTLAPTYTPVLWTSTSSSEPSYSCQGATFEYISDIEPYITRFGDTAEVAGATARIALAPMILELQSIFREYERINPPNCAFPAVELIDVGLQDVIDGFIDFAAESEHSALSNLERGFDGIFDGFDQLLALSEGWATPAARRLATRSVVVRETVAVGIQTIFAPTETPLPVGSVLTFEDSLGGMWALSVQRVDIAEKFSSVIDLGTGEQIETGREVAAGKFAVVILSVTNVGTSTENVVEFMHLRDEQGEIYIENFIASSYAERDYGLGAFSDDPTSYIHPGDTVNRVKVFDVPVSGTYVLTPRKHPGENGVLVNVP